MREIHYNQTAQLRTIAILAGLAVLCFVLGAWIIAVILAVGVAAMLKLSNGGPALRFDDHTVELNTVFSKASVAWTDVRSVEAQKLTSYVLGFIPVASATTLRIKLAGGMFGGKTYSISMDQLDLPKEEWPGLLETLTHARIRASSLSEAAASAARLGANQADAIIARHLAQKQQSPAQTAQSYVGPERRSQPRPTAIAQETRPQFGRRMA